MILLDVIEALLSGKRGRLHVDAADRDEQRRTRRHARGIRSVSVDTARDPRYNSERARGYGTSAPYLPNRLGRPARRTGHPAGHVPVMAAPRKPLVGREG